MDKKTKSALIGTCLGTALSVVVCAPLIFLHYKETKYKDFQNVYNQALIQHADTNKDRFVSPQEESDFCAELMKTNVALAHKIVWVFKEKPRFEDGRIVPANTLVKMLEEYQRTH